MARAPAFRTSVVAELHRQLQYAPRDAVRRQMDAAETLVGIVEPDRAYPIDFVTYRITGYRPSGTDSEADLVAGDELLGDLVALVLRFSRAIGFAAAETGRRPLEPEALAGELGVSVRTLQRWRTRGLVWHWLRPTDGGDARPVVLADAFAGFRARHPELVARAGGFRRATAEERLAIVESARRLRAVEPSITLAAASRRLAPGAPLGREAIRALLVAHEREAATRGGTGAIFHPPAALDARARRLLHRADAAGIAVRRLAERLGRDPATIRRALRRARAERAAAIAPTWVELPTFDRPGAAEVILAPASVRRCLGDLPSATEVLAAAAAAGGLDDPEGTEAMAAAMHFLRRRATRALEGAGSRPDEAVVDAVERDLRWAGLLRCRLVARGLVPAMVQVGRVLAAPPASLPRTAVESLLRRAAAVAGIAVDEHDPLPRGASRRASLAARIVRAMDRHLAASSDLAALAPRGRASARADLGAVDVAVLALAGDRVLPALRPPARVRVIEAGLALDRAAGGPDERRRLVERVWALDGDAPATVAELAAAAGTTVVAQARNLRSETRRLLRLGATSPATSR